VGGILIFLLETHNQCLPAYRAFASIKKWSWLPRAHICNPTYLGGRDQEDRGSKSALGIVCKTLSGKNPSQKRNGRVPQVVGPSFKPKYTKKEKEKKKL
jgi:hypothetical protein